MSISAENTTHESVAAGHTAPEPTPEEAAQLEQLYRDFDRENLIPLWTEIADLMPMVPSPEGRAARLAVERPVPAGRPRRRPGPGGPRRGTPRHRPGQPGPGRHPVRHPDAVGGHPVPRRPRDRPGAPALPERVPLRRRGRRRLDRRERGPGARCRRGDFLLTPGWNFHGHHNDTDEPMAWIDGLDIPFVHYADAGFFEFGTERVTDEATPDISRSERLWAHPGLRPLSGLDDTTSSPIAAYRWEHTDRALREQLLLEDEGHPATVVPGPRRRPLHQPHHRRGRDAHHPRRIPPPPRRRHHRSRPRGRLQRLAGLRRHRHRGPERRNQDPGQGRPVRRPVLAANGPCRRTGRPSSTCSASATPPFSNG